MAKKEFKFKGMTAEELKNLSIEEFIKLIVILCRFFLQIESKPGAAQSS
mgnify:CR=1 FL=1